MFSKPWHILKERKIYGSILEFKKQNTARRKNHRNRITLTEKNLMETTRRRLSKNYEYYDLVSTMNKCFMRKLYYRVACIAIGRTTIMLPRQLFIFTAAVTRTFFMISMIRKHSRNVNNNL